MNSQETQDTSNTKAKIQLAFAAIDKTLQGMIPTLDEEEIRGKEYISWGKDNMFPEYIHGLLESVTSLRTIVQGSANFVAGNDTKIEGKEEVNRQGDTPYDLVWLLARDLFAYGCAAIQVIRDKDNKVSELYWMDVRFVRSSKKNDMFYYSKDFSKRYARSAKTLTYPKFIDGGKAPSSVIFIKLDRSTTYGQPQYIASLTECEIERQLSEYNLSQVENGFNASYVMTFAGGIPDDEQKDEIERNVNEKFCGSSNAGRVLLNFCNGKDNGVDLQKLDIENFADKYNSTADRARSQIYAAFGANPNLFGLPTENLGFNSEEYNESFKLYNRVRIRPIQKKIVEAIDKAYGVKGITQITPFSLDEDSENNVKNINEE